MKTEQQLISIYTPYCYLIGWSDLDKYYYGVRYARGCSPEDLWRTYFTSSKLVAKYVSLYGNPNIVQVRKVFNLASDAIIWEQKVLKRLNVLKNPRFLNKNISGAIPLKKCASYGMLGKNLSQESKQKIRLKAIGRKHSNETKQKLSSLKKGKKIKITKSRRLEHTLNQAKAIKKQIKIKLKDREWLFDSRKELIQQFGMRLHDMIMAMEPNSKRYIVKVVSKKTKHPFGIGDVLEIEY